MGLSLRTPGNSQRIFAIWASRRTRWKSSKSARLVLQPNTADQAAASSVLLSSPAPTSFTVRPMSTSATKSSTLSRSSPIQPLRVVIRTEFRRLADLSTGRMNLEPMPAGRFAETRPSSLVGTMGSTFGRHLTTSLGRSPQKPSSKAT